MKILLNKIRLKSKLQIVLLINTTAKKIKDAYKTQLYAIKVKYITKLQRVAYKLEVRVPEIKGISKAISVALIFPILVLKDNFTIAQDGNVKLWPICAAMINILIHITILVWINQVCVPSISTTIKQIIAVKV